MGYYFLLIISMMRYIIDNIMSMYEIMLITEYWDSVNVNPSIPYCRGSDFIIVGNFNISPIIMPIINLNILNSF